MSINRKIRRSQYITPFGVGSILDIGNESLIAMDTSKWKKNSGDKITLKRLAKKLNVIEFRMPEIQKNSWDTRTAQLPFSRFPRWLFCSSCRTLTFWAMKLDKEKEGAIPRCQNNKCKSKNNLTPMRFVAACKDGHLTDIDWPYWAHSESQGSNCRDKTKLKFRTKPKVGGSLASLEIFCEACNAKRNLSDILSLETLSIMGVKCKGTQPWEFATEDKVCNQKLQVIQRGASNIYFPKVISALDIPTENESENLINDIQQQVTMHKQFRTIVGKKASSSSNISKEIIDFLIQEILNDIKDANKEMILNLINDDASDQSEMSETLNIDERDVLLEEWPMLLDPPLENSCHVFSAIEEPFSKINKLYGLEKLFKKIVLVTKLREVRVLRGFQRIAPSNDNVVSPSLGQKTSWLPATEVFGEGIFIAFSNDAIESWKQDNKKALDSRLLSMQSTYEREELSFLPNPTIKFVLLHTFSHLLIRQLSFECGYASSSLRERIYSDDNEMAGILIYTADSDSEGSLGGLVRQGKMDRFIPAVLTALERGSWCSSDPICRELPGQGMRGLNKAACHACALLSETSCTSHNALLDRMLLLGKDENRSYGFFNSVIEAFLKDLK